tara:strand:- start:499 stop:675 length:177 start_codon:yes stop_codon:yes gene_type:complete
MALENIVVAWEIKAIEAIRPVMDKILKEGLPALLVRNTRVAVIKYKAVAVQPAITVDM